MTERETVELKIGASVAITDMNVDKSLSIFLRRKGLQVGSKGIVKKVTAKVCNVLFDQNLIMNRPFYQIIPARCLGVI